MHRTLIWPDVRLIQKPDTGYPDETKFHNDENSSKNTVYNLQNSLVIINEHY
jgi:hypothetical protein